LSAAAGVVSRKNLMETLRWAALIIAAAVLLREFVG